MLDEETSLLARGKTGTGSLMTSFVRALDTHRKEEANVKNDTGQSLSKGLTVDEILGNIFVINFAGHDTTANTLAFGMLLLAANPEVQDWVAEELREVVKNVDSENWDYSVLFPELKRCRAVLVSILYLDPNISEPYLYISWRLFVSTPRSWHFPNGAVSTRKSSASTKGQL
jgi:cytochrome P450